MMKAYYAMLSLLSNSLDSIESRHSMEYVGLGPTSNDGVVLHLNVAYR